MVPKDNSIGGASFCQDRRLRSVFARWGKSNPELLEQQKIGNLQEKLVNSQFWQGHKDLNPEPTVLETAALPIELYPYIQKGVEPEVLVGLQGFEPGTIRL